MAYRFNGTDPFLRTSIGALNGWSRNSPLSCAALLKRIGVSTWQGIHTIDDGAGGVFMTQLEFDPSNELDGGNPTVGWASAATFNDTSNWMIVAFDWSGGSSPGDWIWRWKIGAGAWANESEDPDGQAAAAGAGYRNVIGNEPGLGDDANYDLVCVGAITSRLTQAQIESLTMTDFASWKAVFAGSGAWLVGFDAISSRVDASGNGGGELSRSGGITLVADPPGFAWGEAGYSPRHAAVGPV